MAYKVIVSPCTQKEIENAIDYYALYGVDAPVNFITALKEAYGTLKTSPFFRVRYRNIRALKLRSFRTPCILLSMKIKIRFGYFPVSTTREIQINGRGINSPMA